MPLVTVHVALTSSDAQVIRSRLEAAGLHPILKDEMESINTPGQGYSTGGVKVQVPDDEEEDARRAIDSKSSS